VSSFSAGACRPHEFLVSCLGAPAGSAAGVPAAIGVTAPEGGLELSFFWWWCARFSAGEQRITELLCRRSVYRRNCAKKSAAATAHIRMKRMTNLSAVRCFIAR
jgi:hypothetical protein